MPAAVQVQPLRALEVGPRVLGERHGLRRGPGDAAVTSDAGIGLWNEPVSAAGDQQRHQNGNA
jgi:hypothetical protein